MVEAPERIQRTIGKLVLLGLAAASLAEDRAEAAALMELIGDVQPRWRPEDVAMSRLAFALSDFGAELAHADGWAAQAAARARLRGALREALMVRLGQCVEQLRADEVLPPLPEAEPETDGAAA